MFTKYTEFTTKTDAKTLFIKTLPFTAKKKESEVREKIPQMLHNRQWLWSLQVKKVKENEFKKIKNLNFFWKNA